VPAVFLGLAIIFLVVSKVRGALEAARAKVVDAQSAAAPKGFVVRDEGFASAHARPRDGKLR
jgi:hypothetical protein